MKDINIGERVPDSTVAAFFASTKGPRVRLRVGGDDGAAQARKERNRAKAKAARKAKKAQR